MRRLNAVFLLLGLVASAIADEITVAAAADFEGTVVVAEEALEGGRAGGTVVDTCTTSELSHPLSKNTRCMLLRLLSRYSAFSDASCCVPVLRPKHLQSAHSVSPVLVHRPRVGGDDAGAGVRQQLREIDWRNTCLRESRGKRVPQVIDPKIFPFRTDAVVYCKWCRIETSNVRKLLGRPFCFSNKPAICHACPRFIDRTKTREL